MRKFISLFIAVAIAVTVTAFPVSAAEISGSGSRPVLKDLDDIALGDVTADGKIDSSDALEILQYSVGISDFSENQLVYADVNDDLNVNSVDALLVLKLSVGLLQRFPGNNPDNQISGTKIVIGSSQSGKYSSGETGEAYTAQINAIEQVYGCEVSVVSSSDDAETLASSIKSEQFSADIAEVSLGTARTLAKYGLCADLNTTGMLNRDVCNSGLTEASTVNGHVYAVGFKGMSNDPLGVFYNKKRLARYAPDFDIEALYDNDEWTYDALEEVAAACTIDRDGDGKPDIFGITANTTIIGMAVTSNAVGNAAYVPQSGKIEASVFSKAGIRALEWCRDMRLSRYWQFDNSNTCAMQDFCWGTSSLYVGNLSSIDYIRSLSNSDIGFVPAPIGEAQTEYIQGTYNGNVYIVPKNRENNLGRAVRVLNRLSGVSDKLIDIACNSFSSKGMDEHSVEAYRNTFDTYRGEFISGAVSSTITSSIDSCVLTKSNLPATVAENIGSQLQQALDDYYDF